MSRTIDLVLITGYLGAGKTTLLNHLLRMPSIATARPALVVNEFGQEGIDGRLVDAEGRPLFEINSGSLFCFCTKNEFLAALNRIAEDLEPGIVLVEATGVAESRDIEAFLDEPRLVGRFRVRANLCLVDTVGFTKVAPYLRAIGSQIAAADGIVVNKIDQAPEEELTAVCNVVRRMNPRAPQARVAFAEIDEAFLGGLTHVRNEEALALAPTDAVCAASLRFAAPLDRRRFETAVSQLGERLLRLKGNIHFEGEPGPRYVESVAGRQTEKNPIAGMDHTAFTAIAYGVTTERLKETFRQAMAPNEE